MPTITTTAVADPIHEAREVSRRARALQRKVEEVNARRREIIAELVNAGLTHIEIARLLDLSRQRVSQYVDELRTTGVLEPRTGKPAAGDELGDDDDGTV